MSQINTGGPAFPHWDGPSGECFNGMTLRDYFAAKAMIGFLASDGGTGFSTKDLACACYVMADAMLKAREA